MNKQKIKIDIVTDINCPWCYIGEHRLKTAIAEASNAYDFDVHIKPFELSPNAPQEGESKREYFIRNYGSEALARLNASSSRLTEMGRAEGVTYDFDKATTVHNTFNGHRLIWLAGQYGVQEKVTEALYRSNFSEGKNVNDTSLLTEIGVANGIPAERLENFFSGEEGKAEVREMERQAQQSGINGVPAFIFNDQYLVSGAQPAETFVKVFGQIAPVYQEIQTEGESCAIDGSC